MSHVTHAACSAVGRRRHCQTCKASVCVTVDSSWLVHQKKKRKRVEFMIGGAGVPTGLEWMGAAARRGLAWPVVKHRPVGVCT
jgi:hypothetical protein